MVESSTKDTTHNQGRELSLGDDFGPAVVRFNGLTVTTDRNGNVKLENGLVTVDIADGNTSVFGGNVTAHTDGTVQLKATAPEQTNAPSRSSGVIASSVDVKSFSPDNSMIRAGTVRLNKISRFLSDLPDIATATLLVSPQDLANIDGGGLGTWVNSIKRIREIEGYHGLDGMEVYDRPQHAPNVTLEENITNYIRALFYRAQSSGQEVTTGLFMPTKQLVHGRELGSGDVTVDTNLYSKRKEIGKQGDEFITEHSSGIAAETLNAHMLWSATESTGPSALVCGVDMTGYLGHSKDGRFLMPKDKKSVIAPSRPVALALKPPA